MVIKMSDWIDVPGIPYFQVTSNGRVKAKSFVNETAVNRWGNVCARHYKEREITPILINPPGYLKVSALRQKNRPKYYVHRLVALAFVDGYKDGYHVNHINGIKTDNRASNLEWVTSAQNIKLAWESGLCNSFGENNKNSKLTSKQVIAIRKCKDQNISDILLAELTNVTAACIAKIKNNKTWSEIKE